MIDRNGALFGELGAAPRAMLSLSLGLALWIAAPAAAQEPTPSDAEARSLFDAGASAYAAGRYDEALRHFQRSHELSGRPALLFNIGTAAERTRDDELALRSYEQYLERVPDAENRERVLVRIEFLRRQIAAANARPAEPAPPDPAPSDPGGAGPGPIPWVLVGTGAAAAVAGGILLGVGLSDRAAVEDPAPGARWADAAASYERGPALLTSSFVLLPLGVVLAGVGVVWAVVGSSGGGETAALRIGPTSIELTGSF